MKLRLIGFTGGMGSGKSTAIEVLRQTSSASIKLCKFAQPLYDIQEYTYERISSVYQRPENFIKDRKLLQWVGTEWGRNTLDENIWTDLWKKEVNAALEDRCLVVCDDVRYNNEAELVHDLGGVIINVASSRVEERDVVKGIEGHPSENGVPRNIIDYEIRNNGTLEEYKASLCKLYRMLGVSANPQGE